jgi:2-dehydro-3-deoxygluconokinase
MSENKNQLDAVTMGETMMAFEAQDYGPLREVHHFKKWIGGAEDNFAIGLSRLGFHCGWISRLGSDEFGKEIKRTIKGEGIDVSHVVFDPDAPTGVFIVERQAAGDFRCFYYRHASAASRLSPDDIDSEFIGKARVLYLTGITPAISPSAAAAVDKVFSIAKKNKQPIVFDPNLRLKLCSIDRAREILVPLMQESSYVLPGEEELKHLMDCKDIESAIAKAHRMNIHHLIIKKGKLGADIAFSGGLQMHVPAFVVTRPISSMGAGDCFAAGFVAGLLKDISIEESVRWGNAMGAFCMMGWGPYQTLPDMQELNSFLAGSEMIAR